MTEELEKIMYKIYEMKEKIQEMYEENVELERYVSQILNKMEDDGK